MSLTGPGEADGNNALPPIFGRRREMDELCSIVDRVAIEQAGQVVVLVGEAGSGKSRLAEELTLAARQSGLATRWSIGNPLADGPSLGPWQYVIDRLAPVSAHRPAERGRTRWDMFNGLLDDLTDVVDGPTLVVIDDLHESDDDTLAFTRFAAPALHDVPLLVLATWRDSGSEPHPDVRLGHLADVATIVELSALDDHEAESLAQTVADRALDAATLSAIVGAAGGNPMHLRELAQRPSRGDNTAPLRVLLADRMRHLDPNVCFVASAVALHPGPVPVAMLPELVGLSTDDLVDVVAASTGLLVAEGGAVRLHHGLVGEAAAANVETGQLRELHLRAVEVVGRHPEGPVLTAELLERATQFGIDDPARRFDAARGAAAQLWQRLSWRAALGWFERAATIAHDAALPHRWGASLAHAVALQRCGQLTDARSVFVRIARAQVEDSVISADAALGVPGIWVEEQRDPIERMRMLGWCRTSLDGLASSETARRAELAVRIAAEGYYDGGELAEVQAAVEEVRASGDRSALARSLSLLHHCLLGPDHGATGPADVVRRADVAAEMIDAAIAAGEEFYATLGLLWQVVDSYLDGHPDAEARLVPLARRVETLQIDSLGYIVDVIDVMRGLRVGNFASAEDAAGRAVERGLATGDNDAMAYYVGQLACIRWLQGRIVELEPEIRKTIDSGVLRGHDRVYPALLALVCARRGEMIEAESIAHGLMSSGSDDARRAVRLSTWTTSMAALGEYAALRGDGSVAEWVLNELGAYSGMVVMPSLAVACLGPADRTLGLCAATMGRFDEAIDWFRRAERQNATLGNLPVGVLISANLAAALRSSGCASDLDEATAVAASARRRADALGIELPPDPVLASPRAASEFEDVTVDPVGGDAQLLGRLERHERHWELDLDGRSCELRDSIGLRYIALLLAHPNRPIDATELSDRVRDRPPSVPSSAAAPVFDDNALDSFRRRIVQIEFELERADRRGDQSASQRLIREHDHILDEVRRGTGLRGRSRRLDDDSERARGRVGAGIRRSLRSIAERDAVLGHQLMTAIQLGHACVYTPDPARDVAWQIRV